MATQRGVNKKRGWYNCHLQCTLPNSDGRGQVHLMPVRLAQQCREATVRGATTCDDGLLVISTCHLAPLGCTASRHVRLEWSCGDTSTDALEHGRRVVASPRQAPCRGRCLVAPGSLLLAGSCRDARRGAASFLKCLGWPSRQAPLAGALSFPASSSCRSLVFSAKTLCS